jgi:DNA excision repair protein ERCC-3
MHPKFYEIYLTNPNSEKKKVLYVSNPIKYLATLILLEKHKGEKIIIFSDNLFTINQYDKFFQERILKNSRGNTNINQNDISLNYKKITGDTTPKDRNMFLKEFKNNNKVNILLMTKVGDISIDIPNASVIIQVSSHFGSRMQEAQRFGRILRPKKDALSEYNAFFYTIVSKNTEEMAYSNKRHRFLVDQGYYFNVVTKLEEIFDNKEELKEKDLINKFENDRNYTKYVEDTYNLITEKNEFRNDYNDEENSFDILNNLDEEEIDKDNKSQ